MVKQKTANLKISDDKNVILINRIVNYAVIILLGEVQSILYTFQVQQKTHRLIENFIDETFSKSLNNEYTTNKTDVFHIDGACWSLDIIESNVCDSKNYRIH